MLIVVDMHGILNDVALNKFSINGMISISIIHLNGRKYIINNVILVFIGIKLNMNKMCISSIASFNPFSCILEIR